MLGETANYDRLGHSCTKGVSMFSRFLTALIFVTCSAVQAVAVTSTFNYSGTVTSGAIVGGGTSFGNPGDAATASLTLNYTAGESIPVGPVSGGFVDFSISSPNFSYSVMFSPEGFNDGFNSSISASTTGVSFFTSSGTFSWPNFGGQTLRTGFIFDFAAPLVSAPTTFDALAAALGAPGSTLTFRTNGDFLFSSPPGRAFDEYQAELTINSNAIPLPATAWLLCVALSVLAVTRRKPV